MAFLDNTGVTRLVTDLKSKFATLVSGAVAVTQGGTGKTTHTANAVITGNGTSAVNNVATADGALYATAANGAAQFGTLPVAQGGTAGTTEAEARESLEVPVNASIATVESATATANHAIGDHFMLDDKLKTATAAIATGETINATNSADDTVQGQIDTLRDSLSWKSGDTFSINALTVGGFITGTKEVFFIIPLSKPMYGTPSVTFATLAIRQDGSYPFGFSSSKPTVNYQMILTNSTNWINVRLVFDSSAGINNESVSVYAYGTVTVS